MLLKYFRFLLISLFLPTSGCMYGSLFYDAFFVSHKCQFSIEELPNATVNQPYFAKIEIWGGGMPNENNIQWEATPEHSGLTITRFTDKDSGLYGGVEISGVPKFQGDITLQLYGFGYGYYCGFDKVFVLKVNPPTEQAIKD